MPISIVLHCSDTVVTIVCYNPLADVYRQASGDSQQPTSKGPYTLTSFLVPVAGASFWRQLPTDE